MALVDVGADMFFNERENKGQQGEFDKIHHYRSNTQLVGNQVNMLAAYMTLPVFLFPH